MALEPQRATGVALVTGAASGIGHAIARTFVQEGCTRLILVDLNNDGLHTVAQEIKELNPAVECCLCVCDVSLEDDVQRMIEQGVEAFGGIHYAVNNAGITSPQRVRTNELDLASYEKRAEIRQMLKQEADRASRTGAAPQRGAIVNLASIFAHVSLASVGAYSATKAAVLGMTKTDAIAYAKDGIRINAVSPGTVLTPLLEKSLKAGTYSPTMVKAIPMDRFGRPEEIAEGVLFLASEKASFITGQELIIDGGSLSYYVT
ncbi:short chain dehydrogenase/ reductase [Aspergillus insuetus]